MKPLGFVEHALDRLLIESDIMPRNTPPTPGTYPSDDEPYNHRGQSRRLPRNRAEQDHVPRPPQRKTQRRAYSDRPADSSSSTHSFRENNSEDSEAIRGRSSELSISDGERPISVSVDSSRRNHRRNHRRTYPEEFYQGPETNSGRAHDIIGRRRELPWFGCSLISIDQ